MATHRVMDIGDVLAIGGSVMLIGQKQACDQTNGRRIKGRHFCDLSIPSNDRQLKQISKLMTIFVEFSYNEDW